MITFVPSGVGMCLQFNHPPTRITLATLISTLANCVRDSCKYVVTSYQIVHAATYKNEHSPIKGLNLTYIHHEDRNTITNESKCSMCI